MKIDFERKHCSEKFSDIPVNGTFRISGRDCIFLKRSPFSAWCVTNSHIFPQQFNQLETVIPVEVTITVIDSEPDTY